MSYSSVTPIPRRKPMADLRQCPYCLRSMKSIEQGQGHRLGCAVYGSSRDVLAADVEEAALRGHGGVPGHYVKIICHHGYDVWWDCPTCCLAADGDL